MKSESRIVLLASLLFWIRGQPLMSVNQSIQPSSLEGTSNEHWHAPLIICSKR